nr:type II toxin-antitoxin system PemK/MazF family toxin [Ornithinimicrobium sp. CNJ-824]
MSSAPAGTKNARVKRRVMVEQLSVIDPEDRLGESAGRLESAEMRAVDEAMLTVLGLD